MNNKNIKWHTNSWKNFKLAQVPEYENYSNKVLEELSSYEGVVKVNEINSLKNKLSTLEENNGFILQIGECAERFAQANKEDIFSRVEQIQNFAKQIPSKNIIKIGRIAGQYAKPRNQDTEIINGTILPIYRGDMVNDKAFDISLRTPDFNRLKIAYDKSKYSKELIDKLTDDLYTSHEGLILDYEAALTKDNDGVCYASSGHLLWLGERTRFNDSAHIEYLSGICNPIGIKISSNTNPDDLFGIISKINPINEKGKIILIARMGVDFISKHLPKIIEKIKQDNLSVLWMCDPMHGNTKQIKNNYKTRFIDDIINEIILFYNILKKYNLYWAGIHLETSYEDVIECVTNASATEQIKKDKYLTACDPRLNQEQLSKVASLVNRLQNMEKL